MKVSIDKQLMMAEQNLASISGSAVKRAQAMAINRITKRIVSQTVKKTASTVGVKQKVLRKRFSIKKASVKQKSGPTGHITVRRRGIPAISTGKARQTKKGVRVGGKFYPGAFLADGSKQYGKYIRRQHRSGAWKHPYYRTKLRSMQVLRRSSKNRHPLEVVSVPIKQQVTQTLNRQTALLMQTDMPKELKSALAQQVRLHIRREVGSGN